MFSCFLFLVQAFDLDCTDKNYKLSAPEIKEILSCELSPTEFADALSMQSSSPFVLQMFQMADKDRNGYINFREFLDLIFIFAKCKYNININHLTDI